MENQTSIQLIREYEYQRGLFENQPTIVQRFAESQGQVIAGALIASPARVSFSLPDRVTTHVEQIMQAATIAIPEAQRRITVGGFPRRATRGLLERKLNELEKSADQAIAIAGGLLRYAAAKHLIHDLLPAGRDVVYRAEADGDIPAIPVEDGAPESAITQAGDAIVEEGEDVSRGAVQTPFVPAARKFFLPQWVAFDAGGKLLAGTVQEAEAHVASMQRYAEILHCALSLAPYVSASEEYQRKRYGILGQLINQGRALADFKTRELVAQIKSRAAEKSLNRGLSISLPYFDDQMLKLAVAEIEVIPAGRIMFLPAFVVRAARDERAKAAQDTRLNASTRRHLLRQLDSLEKDFIS